MAIVAVRLWQQLAEHKNYRPSQYRFRIDSVRSRNSYHVQDERFVLFFPSEAVKPDSCDTHFNCVVAHFCGLSSKSAHSPCGASSLLLSYILDSSCDRNSTDKSKRPTAFIKSRSNPIRMTSDRVRSCCFASLFISDTILLDNRRLVTFNFFHEHNYCNSDKKLIPVVQS